MGSQAKDFVIIIGPEKFPETDLTTLKQNIQSHFALGTLQHSPVFEAPRRMVNSENNLIVYRYKTNFYYTLNIRDTYSRQELVISMIFTLSKCKEHYLNLITFCR